MTFPAPTAAAPLAPAAAAASTALDGAALARAFLTPRRPATPLPLELPGGRRRRFATPAGELAAVDAGDGPMVLLVHGWEGQASDLAAIAHALLARGLRVIAVDLPAHGESAGRQTSIPASARALHALGRQLGPLHAVVAHSVGAAVATTALELGLAARRAALLSAPAHYIDYVHAFARQAGLDAAAGAALLAALQAQGIDVHAVSLPRFAPRLRQPALFVHSADDRIVPIADAVESSAAWPGARLLRLDGLGHRRILGDAAVVAAVADFVAEAGAAAALSPAPAAA